MANGIKTNGNGDGAPKEEKVVLKKNGDNKNGCCGGHGYGCCVGGDFAKKIMLTLAGVMLVYGIFFLGTLIRNNIKKYDYIGRAEKMERTITVSGVGKVTGANDIAVTSLGYTNTAASVAQAQTANRKVMDGIMADLKALGIEEKDMQSDYSVYPEYNYTQDSGQELKGYRVTSRVTVKIRDLNKIQPVLSLAGKHGANEVSGLSFTIDDPQNLKSEAREKAVADAQVKAMRLANALGVNIVGVVSYTEYDSPSPPEIYMKSALGVGGAEGGGAPDIQGGSKEVMVTATVTYEIAAR